MSKTGKTIWGTFFFIIFTLISIAYLANRLVNKSLPDYSGVYKLQGVKSYSQIFRDEYGVPHIITKNEEDLFFTLGFIHAQDRLWQMHVLRYMAQGRLSELFGKKTLPIDRLVATIGLSRFCEDISSSLSAESKTMLELYVKGINSCIDIRQSSLPVEFIIVNTKPDKWTVKDIIIIHRFISFCNSLFKTNDLILAGISNELPASYLKDINLSKPRVLSQSDVFNTNELLRIINHLQSIRRKINSILPIESNYSSWLIPPPKSQNRKTIISQIIDIPPARMNIYHEVHLNSRFIDYHGFTIAGAPLFLQGKSSTLAWGANNLNCSEIKFYIEQVDSNIYKFNRRWRNIDQYPEIIHVKNYSSDTLNIRRTHHGPILSDLIDEFRKLNRTLSIFWTGYKNSDEFLAAYKLLHARNSQQFIESIQHHKIPALEFLYGDDDDEFGCSIAAAIPLKSMSSEKFILDGTSWKNEWNIEKQISPVQTKNYFDGRHIRTEGYRTQLSSIAQEWSSNHFLNNRDNRFTELMAKNFYVNISDMIRIHHDKQSKFIRYIANTIIRFIPDTDIPVDFRTYLYDILNQDDFEANKDDIVTTICHISTQMLHYNIFADELGDSLHFSLLSDAKLSVNLLMSVLNQENSIFYDNIHTDEIENKSDIIKMSIENTFTFLSEQCGNLVDDWRWGKLTTTQLKHYLTSDSLKYAFKDQIMISARGYGDSIYASRVDYSSDSKISFISGIQHISDFSKSDHTLSLIYCGQADQEINDHYFDQLHLWETGTLKQCNLNTDHIKKQYNHLLTLKPE